MKLTPTPPPPEWRNLECDPICLVFQKISYDESAELLASMRRGYDTTQPIVMRDGKILDGRHRHSTAIASGVVPSFVAFEGTPDEAVDFVWARHAGRRSMTDDAKVQVRMDLEPFRMQPPWRPNKPATVADLSSSSNKSATVADLSEPPPRTVEQVAATLQVSQRRVERGLAVRRVCDRAEIDAVIRGEKTAFKALADHKKAAAAKKAPPGPPPPPPPPTDAAGRKIHPKAAYALGDGRGKFTAIINALRQLKKEMLALQETELGRELHRQTIELESDNLIRQFTNAIPYTSCPLNATCDEKCQLCRGTQWIGKLQWGGVPREFK